MFYFNIFDYLTFLIKKYTLYLEDEKRGRNGEWFGRKSIEYNI